MMPILKRKRSSSELSSSPSSTSSSPPRNDFMTMETPVHLHSRTLKRFRDSRPSEKLIHHRTLGMLYSAQRQAAPTPIPAPIHETQTPSLQQQQPQRQNLHSFWNISSAPRTVTTPAQKRRQDDDGPSSCEDCGVDVCADGMDGSDAGSISGQGNGVSAARDGRSPS
ncbi:hypothetical protein GMORB2_3783 [Geosmithia morbida]|uniref:Uncharacterized protein n=1 Tax=Geosmithia morbida TaxID=1094350 RepID=A0A9P4Z029_9HYPO|nr:uncharacterized protein GMORB2_3783 [Geosmithia morbida]KAF4124944.1 hypothetical protein GMORB2_3783 [Geosmithia morbida]